MIDDATVAALGAPLARFLAGDGIVVLDGGLATELEARGHTLNDALWSARLLVDDPDAIRAVHEAYLDAGADCITTATYQASYPGWAAAGLSEEETDGLYRRASQLARQAREAYLERRGVEDRRPAPLVAASVGPYGAYLADGSEYDGRYGVGRTDLDAFHRRRYSVLGASGVDLLACETIPSALEAEVLLEIAADHPALPLWISFACRDDRQLWDGSDFEEVVGMCGSSSQVVAVGVNCTAPGLVPVLVQRARASTDRAVVAYPNSGERYDATERRWRSSGGAAPGGDEWDDVWLRSVLQAIRQGARLVGGCCRVGPRQIAALRHAVDSEAWTGSSDDENR